MLRLNFYVFDEVFGVRQVAKVFFSVFQEERKVHRFCRIIKQTKNDFLKLQQDVMNIVYFFHSANSLTLNTVSKKNRLSR